MTARGLLLAGLGTLVLGLGPVASVRAEAPARTAPLVTLRMVEGEKLALADLLTKGPVLIDFWATWCKPCTRSLPSLERLHRKYRTQGLTVVAVSIDGPRNFAKVRPFARSLGLTCLVALDEDGSLARRFEVSGVPTSILIGKDRRILHTQVGYLPGEEAALEAAVARALGAEPAGDAEPER